MTSAVTSPAYTKAAKKIAHGKRLKTDEKDAESITALVGDGHFQEFPFLKSVYTGLRQLVSARERLTKLRGGAVSRYFALFPALRSSWLHERRGLFACSRRRAAGTWERRRTSSSMKAPRAVWHCPAPSPP
jgi:hypothetical protein